MLTVSGGLHQRCIQEVPKAWPGWIQKAAGKSGRARPSQDLRVLQYFEKAGAARNMRELELIDLYIYIYTWIDIHYFPNW